MRKSMKLLAILLLACIFVSVMVIGASAVTNADLDATKLTGAISSTKNYFQVDYSNNIKDAQTTAPEAAYAFDWTGFAVFEKVVSRNGNRHASVSNAEAPTAPTVMADGFAGVVFKGSNINLTSLTNASGTTGNHGGYVVYDIDLANISLDSNIPYAALGYLGGSTSHQIMVYIVRNGSEYYASLDTAYDANDIKLSSGADVWTHITVAFTTKTGAQKFYVFVDGEYLGYRDGANGYYQFKHPTIVVGGISAENYDVDFNIDIDNLAVNVYVHTDLPSTSTSLRGYLRYLPDIYETDKLYDCDTQVIYNKNYTYNNAAAGQAFVKIAYTDETSASYYTTPAVRDGLPTIAGSKLDGATMTIRKDVNFAIPDGVSNLTVICKDGAEFTYTGNFSETKTTEDGITTYVLSKSSPTVDVDWLDKDGNKVVTVPADLGGTLNIPADAAANYDASIKGEGAYLWSIDGGEFTAVKAGDAIPETATKIVVKPDVATITWKGAGEVADAVEAWYVGSVLAAGDLAKFDSVKETGVAGWYYIAYAAWEGFVAGETTVSGDAAFTPVKMPVVDDISYKANITLIDKFKFNVYVKVTDAASISNVTLGGSTATAEIGGEDYYKATSGATVYYVGNTESSFAPTLKFTVNFEGNDYELSCVAKVTISEYITKALAAAVENGSTADEKLLANFTNYLKACTEWNRANGSAAWIKTIVSEHSACCLTATVPTEPNGDLTYKTEFAGLGYSVAYSLKTAYNMTENVGIAVYVPKDSVSAVSISFKGIEGNVGNKDITLNLTKSASTETEDVYVTTVATLAIYNMAEDYTVTVTKADESTVSGTFNIYEYAYNYSQSADVDPETLNVITALAGFAEASKAYKMQDVK